MAQQAGPLRLRGQLGGLSFYHHRQYGYLVRQKGGPDKELVATSPQFARTRENASEFSIAAAAGRLIRQAVRSSTGLRGDSNVSQRLTGTLVRMGKSDLTSIRGRRNPATVFNDPDSRKLLRSFAFYSGRPISSVYTGQITCDTTTGSIVLADAVSPDFFHAPKGATHVRIKAAMASLDFDKHLYQVYPAQIYTTALENNIPEPDFTCDVPTTNADFRIGIVAIEFLQEKNGKLYELADGMSLGVVG
jgi:hypothetical protein